MFKFIAAAATVASFATGAAFADGSGHSHAHTHPHDGHAASGAAAYHHTHSEKVTGVEHTHAIHGDMITHQHRKVTATSDYQERVQRGRFQVGAGFGPYTVAEYSARVSAEQPGLSRRQEPWPTRRYRNQN